MVFKCNACGNLHGARVESCGMCGSQDVALVVDTLPPPPVTTPDAVAAAVDPVAAALGPLFEKAFEYVRDRDEARTDRLQRLDDAEDERREAVAVAVTGVCSALTELAKAGTAWLRQQTPTVRDGGSQ